MPSVVRSLALLTACVAAIGVDADATKNILKMCGVDFSGADELSVQATNPDACPFECAARNSERSTWTNYQGGTCWCKDTHHGLVASPGAISYYQEFPEILFACLPPVSPYDSGYDIPGYDVGSARGRNIEDCGTKCYLFPAAWAAVWTDYNGGTCWCKGRGNTMAPKAGAKACLLARRIDWNYGPCK